VVSQKIWDSVLLIMFLLISILLTASLLQWFTEVNFLCSSATWPRSC
jgi:hypothetical protein